MAETKPIAIATNRRMDEAPITRSPPVNFEAEQQLLGALLAAAIALALWRVDQARQQT